MQSRWHEGRMGAERMLRRRLNSLCIEESTEIPRYLGFGCITRLGQVNFKIEVGAETFQVKQRISGKTIVVDVLRQQIEEVIQIITGLSTEPCTKQQDLSLAA